MGKSYLIDANALISAKSGPYGFDILPVFWEWLSQMCDDKIVMISTLVYEEVKDYGDELSEWIIVRKSGGSILEPSQETQKRYSEIADHVEAEYEDHHVKEFLSGADPWIIAQALSDNSIVVTQEAAIAKGAKRVKIPNVCSQFNVDCINLYAMMRDLKFDGSFKKV